MVTAYLKRECGWSRGVREVLGKYGIEYEERQIHDPVHFQEMVEKTKQTNQPCVQLDEESILTDISGEELETYLVANGYEYKDDTSDVPLDKSCTDEEHEEMKQKEKAARQPVQGISVRDTSFYRCF